MIAGFTTLLGAIVLTIGKLIERIWIEPIKDFQNTKSEIMTLVTFYQNYVPTDADDQRENIAKLRMLASKFRAFPSVIPNYGLATRMQLVPKRNIVIQASASLIGLSNSLGPNSPKHAHVEKLTELLEIPIHGEQFIETDSKGCFAQYRLHVVVVICFCVLVGIIFYLQG